MGSLDDSKDLRQKERVAIVGSGIGGLSAAYILAKNGYNVTLYEKNHYCGGHTLTDTTAKPPVDLGFMVFNLKNYPHLVGFFEDLEVDHEESDMSFSVTVNEGEIEWASHGLSSVFCQKKNLVSLKFWTMIYDVVRFSRHALEVLKDGYPSPDVSVGDFLKQHNYSDVFLYHYLLPMSAAIWSAPNATVMQFPIKTLVQFFANHCMLDPFGDRPNWRTLKYRGKSYVNKVLEHLSDVRVNTGVEKIQREGQELRIIDQKGQECVFDKVIMATHPDQALEILGDSATDKQKEILKAIPYQSNIIYLHSDASMMPSHKEAWASWNVLYDEKKDTRDSESVFVTYWLNRLQNLPKSSDHRFCTLNPPHPPEGIIRHVILHHPLLTQKAVEAQKQVPSIQGQNGLYFCGAWCGYGFHEDGIKSAVAMCEAFNPSIVLPWTPKSVHQKPTMLQKHCFATFDALASRAISRGGLRLILPSGKERFYGNSSKVHFSDEEEHKVYPQVTLRVMDMDFFVKIISSADIGLGEAYMAHAFETMGYKWNIPKIAPFGVPGEPREESREIRRSDEVTRLIELAIVNNDSEKLWKSMKGSSALTALGSIGSWIYHKTRANTVEGSKSNISESYDLSNELFDVLLKPSWMYSSAYYKTGKETLEEAQFAKLDMIIAKANLKPGDHVLEIGCGWGEFAIRAAKTAKCRVTGVTISKEQLKLARERVKAAGVEDLVEIVEIDYRKIQAPAGGFDAIVSIEMLEAVGQEYLGEYHSTLDRLLKPQGKAVIQVITTPEWRYQSYSNRVSSDFIARYIFPGSHLPSVSACVKAAQPTSLILEHKEDIGLSYAPTLREWRVRLIKNREKVLQFRQYGKKENFDDRFMRMYEFYFAYCEAAFRTRYIGDYQLVWVKDASKKQGVRAAAEKAEGARRLRATYGWASMAIVAAAAARIFMSSSMRRAH